MTFAMRVRVVRPTELRSPEYQRWQQLIRGNPDLCSPFFRPQFTLAVSDVRDDVFVGLIERQSTIAGILPFQRMRRGAGLPVGGPLNDYHGLIAAPDQALDLRAAIRRMGLSSWRFHGLVRTGGDSQWPLVFCRRATSLVEFPASGGFDAYLSKIRRRHARTFSDQRKRKARLEARLGPLRLDSLPPTSAGLEQLVGWKRVQYRTRGVVDVFSPAWTLRLLYRLWPEDEPGFAARFYVLLAGEVPIAAHFGLQSDKVMHAWFPAYDPEFARDSPGLQMWIELLRAAANSGVRRFDFGHGEEAFKQKLATDRGWVAEGIVARNRLRAKWSRTCFRAARRVQHSRWREPLKSVMGPLVTALRSRRFR